MCRRDPHLHTQRAGEGLGARRWAITRSVFLGDLHGPAVTGKRRIGLRDLDMEGGVEEDVGEVEVNVRKLLPLLSGV